MGHIAWRYQWENKADESIKKSLITYNREDCEALSLLICFINDIAASKVNIDFLDRQHRLSTIEENNTHRVFNRIIKCAHAEYENRKIHLSDNQTDHESNKKISIVRQRLYSPRANKIINVRRCLKCPKCHLADKIRVSSNSELLITDLKFNKQGCKKIVTKFTGPRIHCLRCGGYYSPKSISDLKRGKRFGYSFMAWAVNQRIVYRLPYLVIAQAADETFTIKVSESSLIYFIATLAERYKRTEKFICNRIFNSPFIHLDETQININGISQYVWVFTNGAAVIFKLTETRDAGHLQKIFTGYKGVLVSDFFGGYDAVPCAQQKCLVHLIRDINDDLWKEPFNKEFEIFAEGIRSMFEKIFIEIDQHGSKQRHFRKHFKSINHFYQKYIDNVVYDTEIAVKYQKRFKRYRNSLFTFMHFDNLPWNNNMAERAIRHLAIQRKISGSFGEHRAPQYLRMLSIAQSCRFHSKNFLKFLISGHHDLNKYKEPTERLKYVKRRIPISRSGNLRINAEDYHPF